MRGKILKDTTSGDGVIFVEGGQKTFSLTAHWKSENPPVTGAVVEVELNENKEIISVSLVDESQLAKEQAKKIADSALGHVKEAALLLHKRVGTVTLALTAVLFIAWTMLVALNIHISSHNVVSVSFLGVLKIVNSGNGLAHFNSNYGSSGIYFFLMLGSLLLPALSHFYTNKYSSLGYCAPFVFMCAIGISIYLGIYRGMGQAEELSAMYGANNPMIKKMMAQMVSSVIDSISLGAGFYCAVVVATYLAFLGIRKYLAKISN